MHPLPLLWNVRPWIWLTIRERQLSKCLRVDMRAGYSENVLALPPSPPPANDDNWVLDKQRLISKVREGRMVLVDCVDVAMTYGETRGTIDFAGIAVVIESLLQPQVTPPWKLFMFEHEWEWWKSRRHRSWAKEENFIQEAESTGLIALLPSGNTWYSETRQLMHAVEEGLPSHCGFRSLDPWEPLQREGPSRLHGLGLSPTDIAAACATQSGTGRLLGQVATLARYARDRQALIMTNDYRQFQHLPLLSSALFDYVAANRHLYSIVGDSLIIQQDSIRALVRSASHVA
eukprot:Protomagalhaensia_sp_Gyna_25__4702@NODE_451_length_3394_cov_207_665872_g346_i0_p2_GENE_NODE_451_length_3394_cov_207_665872_g346_i0NODE_451_length_3394_cov_207_665872_g346_i0_p2_ORF_typecomplete_len289_score25_28RNase_Zc3h12a/PF11977_8/0_00026RNase_Zc3h12a/PF11977_8/5_1_NODE_451_length_3394_cov_207_665872_g346_i013262192